MSCGTEALGSLMAVGQRLPSVLPHVGLFIEQHVSSRTARGPATRLESCILNLVTKVKSQNPYCIPLVRSKSRDFLVVQWLRLHAPSAGGLGSIHGRGTRSHMPQLRVQTPKLRPGSAKCINKNILKKEQAE